MNERKPCALSQRGRPRSSRIPCNTKRVIILPFRVTWKEYQSLIQKAGGKGKLSAYIRKKLELEQEANEK